MSESHASSPVPGSDAPRGFVFPQMEEQITAYWKQERVFERTLDERPEKKTFVFYDGPPFATGTPHYGHLLQSTIKDAVPRYWTMKGYRVPRVWGWDCHGLPIENLIEKDLNLGSKKAIEDHGVDKFNAACRATVFMYEAEWAKYIERLGRWVNFDDSYKTMDTSYMESVWWVFAELHKKSLIYKDVRVSLYCPRCETPIANFEVAMGESYIEREDPAIFIKFPVVGEAKTFFVAWTTTPWSVPGITGLSVHPDMTYVALHDPSTGETLICAETRQAEVLKHIGSDPASIKVTARWKGTELVGKHFEVPYTFVSVEGDAFRVVAGAHVTDDVGTGIVTTAPAYGEEDLNVARENHLPLIQTVDTEGRLIKECGPFAGQKVKEADPLIVEDLRKNGWLLHAETIKHNVPICWRCSTLLLYKAQDAWFVNVTTLKPTMLKAAKKINWHPDHFKEGRFGKGLNTAPDWNISRTRYWGTPLPVWECADCHERTVLGSLEELKTKAKPGTLPEPLDLHRPMIDGVIIPCACGSDQRRIPDVFDCWFESGSMPTASIHYPFEHKRWFEEHAPADFIGEAQDQTRGWFYTLHVLASALFERPAFTNATVTGMILAEDGKKMSKKLKNYPDPWHIFTTYGADALRFYLLSSPVVEADSLNFSERDLTTVVRGFLNLIWNVKVFYETYATQDVPLTKPRSMHVLDRWLFARLEQLTEEMIASMDGYELAKAARPLRGFVDDLSTWWLRRSRDRMKSSDPDEKMDALRTLREALQWMSMLIAPFTPFLAERLYLDLGGLKTSVHLEKWPVADERLLDQNLLDDMRWVRDMSSRAHELRAAAKSPVRQALASLTITLRDAETMTRRQQRQDLLTLLCEEINVEQIILRQDASITDTEVVLDTVLTPALERKGLRREFSRQVMNIRKAAGLQATDRIRLVCHAPADLQEAIEEGREEIESDLRAESLLFVETMPDEVAVQIVNVGGREVQLALV